MGANKIQVAGMDEIDFLCEFMLDDDFYEKISEELKFLKKTLKPDPESPDYEYELNILLDP